MSPSPLSTIHQVSNSTNNTSTSQSRSQSRSYPPPSRQDEQGQQKNQKLSLAVPPRVTSTPSSTTRTSAPSSSTTRAPTQPVESVLTAPNSATSVDFNVPLSAASATTSFRLDRLADAGGVASSSTTTPGRPSEDIEMDPIAPAGHRRRRSTLTFNQNSLHGNSGSGAGASGHRRQVSYNRRNSTLEGDAKISEESREGFLPREAPGGSGGDDSLSDEDLHDDEETGLTRKEKKRKERKRRRNTRLDQRIAREKLSDEDRKEADQTVIRRLAVNGVLIALWYIFSLSISLYNKWMFDSDRLNFAFPLFTTSMHMLVQFALSCLVLYFVPSLRPSNAQHSSDLGRSRHETEPERDRPVMSKTFYFTRIGPCGAATGLDIGLGNTSLKFITLTFYTMCKSSSLAFVLIFAFLFRLESPTWRLVAIIATMTVGVLMMVAGEIEFELSGFVLVISAAFFSGFRWGLTQILLLRNPATSNPFSSIFFLAPIMFLTLMLIAVPVEGIPALIGGLRELSAEWGPVKTPLILLFPGTIAFLMTASEFTLLKRSSVVTLSIAGIFKEVLTIGVAAVVFDDRLTPINISGLVITLIAIGFYNYMKLSKMRDEAQLDVQQHHHQDELPPPQGGGLSGSSSSERGGSGSSSDSDEEEAGLLAAHNKDDSDSSDDSDDDNDDGNMLAVGGTPKPGSPSYVDESRPNRTGQ